MFRRIGFLYKKKPDILMLKVMIKNLCCYFWHRNLIFFYSSDNDRKKYHKLYHNIINYWGPYLWNKCLDDNEKVILSMPLFSSIIKRKLLYAENETSFF